MRLCKKNEMAPVFFHILRNFLKSYRKLDHENYLCTLLLPDPVRITAFAIRAFNIELSRIQDQTTQRETGLLKGKFWEECIDQVYRETPPKHPVLDQIYKVCGKHSLNSYSSEMLFK